MLNWFLIIGVLLPIMINQLFGKPPTRFSLEAKYLLRSLLNLPRSLPDWSVLCTTEQAQNSFDWNCSTYLVIKLFKSEPPRLLPLLHVERAAVGLLDEDKFHQALNIVNTCEVSKREAARRVSLPYSTFLDRLEALESHGAQPKGGRILKRRTLTRNPT